MENKEKNDASTSKQNEKEKSGTKKYNFYRKPSIKKKPPEVKQTLTSYKRMLKANPLLKYELEGKDLSLIAKQLQESSTKQDSKKLDGKNGSNPLVKHSSRPNFNLNKPLISNLQRSNSLKNTKLCVPGPSKIIAGNKPKPGTSCSSINISRQSNVDFTASTSRILSSTKLENNTSKSQCKKEVIAKQNTKAKIPNKTIKTVSQDDVISSRTRHISVKEKKVKTIRRSLSAQHFDRKMGNKRRDSEKSINCEERTRSCENIPSLKPNNLHHDISPIAEGSHESSIIFKTPSAYERRSIARFTPKSTASVRRSIYNPTTSLPSLYDLQKRLNSWLIKRGKRLSSFHHLKYFGEQGNNKTVMDEENKENIESEENASSSYEDLKIEVTDLAVKVNTQKITEENAEKIAKCALEDLHMLIQEGYPRPQCEGWLELIRQKYRKLEEEPQYWECRAAIEQSRGNICNAVECYRTAIVQGAEIQAVDESLDMLLQKFSLLNISTNKEENEKSAANRARIIQDARNVFKSSIIQFAVQERKLKKNSKGNDQRTLVVTPVRRSTRLSRSAYTSTPGVTLCSSLRELNERDKEFVNFKKNSALV